MIAGVIAGGRPVLPVAVDTDPYFSSVELLLHGNGADGSTVFVDSSGSPKTVAPSGNAKISTAQSRFGGSSILLDGTGDYLTVSPTIDLSVGDFCFEYEVYFTADLTQTPVLTNRGGGTGFWISSGYSSGLLRLVWQQWTDYGKYTASAETVTHTLNTWVPICFERIGDVLTVYSGGVARVTLTTADRPGGGLGVTQIGQDTGAPGPTLNGYLDEIRLTKRTGGRYGGAYSPATSEFPNS